MLEATHYESLLEDQESDPTPCPVCTGDEDATPCTEDCANLMRLTAIERGIKGLYQRCRTALFLARIYRGEGWDGLGRMVECLTTVRTYRVSISILRASLRAHKEAA